MQEREQIINYLLQAVDQKNAQIAELVKEKTELQKKLAEQQLPPAQDVIYAVKKAEQSLQK